MWSPRDGSEANTPRVLVADDEPAARELLDAFLTAKGYEVLTASDGEEALRNAKEDRPHLILLDVRMPKMDGLEVLERLRAQDPELPVVMLTADTRSQSVIAALKLGAFDFIVKGMEHDLVVLAVHRAVRHRRDTLNRQREIQELRTRIAELEGGRPKT